jgi:sarcosine/dimethylglycine N-methyltransferase
MTTELEVVRHYGAENITARVLAALRAVYGPDAPITPDMVAPIDHFHGMGLAATRELGSALQPKASDHLLDIGCRIGGPARWFAARFGCRVTGVDLTESYCEAARQLTNLAGLTDRVTILHGSALSLPMPDASFEAAYSQAVLMNISDKRGFALEAFRVLRPGGMLAMSALVRSEPYYPLPWAMTQASSFLATPDQIRTELKAGGFEILSLCDTTVATIEAFTPILKRLETEGCRPWENTSSPGKMRGSGGSTRCAAWATAEPP